MECVLLPPVTPRQSTHTIEFPYARTLGPALRPFMTGLLLGLLGVRALGVAAAIGLVLFFAGALASHMRAHAFHNIAVPGTYSALAISSMALAATVD